MKNIIVTGTSLLAIFFAAAATAQEDQSRNPANIVDSAEMPKATIEGDDEFSTSSTLYLTSNYIFRGLTQTKNKGSIQGSFDITHKSGLGVGGYVATVDMNLDTSPAAKTTSTEADAYLTYNKSFGDHGLGAMVMWYQYVETPHFNAMEYALYYKYSVAKVDVMYMPDYFGTETSSLYYRLSFTIPVTAKNSLLLTGGSTTFDDEKKSQQKTYLDYKIGVTHSNSDFTAEFFYTNTNREVYSTKEDADDKAVGVTLSKSF